MTYPNMSHVTMEDQRCFNNWAVLLSRIDMDQKGGGNVINK